MLNISIINKLNKIFNEYSPDIRSHYIDILNLSDNIGLRFSEPMGGKYIVLAGYHYRKEWLVTFKKSNFTVVLKYDDEKVSTRRFKLIEKEKLVNYINTFKNNTRYKDHMPYENYIDSIKSLYNLDVNWNGYMCSKVDGRSIENAIQYFEKLSEYIPYYKISVYPIPDGGHEVNKPSEDSRSSVDIYLDNGDIYHKKHLEISFIGDGVLVDAYSEIWDKDKSDYLIKSDFRSSLINESFYNDLESFDDIFPFLYWFDSSIQIVRRNKIIDNIII